MGRQEIPETRIEDKLGDDVGYTPFTYSISSYGADFDVLGLVTRIERGDIYVPSFQRSFVWTLTQASRFIESLLLGLPVPGIFLSREWETNKLLVVDGQQRLRTLQYFYRGIFADSGKEFVLRGVQPRFEGMSYRTLSEEDRRRLDDSIIHATIVKQDEPTDDNSSIYYLFERLNTGGTQLQPQEIRACIYHGPFADLLQVLNREPAWRAVFGPVNKRMRDQELILRFLALYYASDQYEKPMKSFLNRFMGKYRKLSQDKIDEFTRVFRKTIDVVNRSIGKQAFKPRKALNAAVFDAVMVGIARRLERGPIRDLEQIREAYENLLEDADFLKSVETGTADEQAVRVRLEKATGAFRDVP